MDKRKELIINLTNEGFNGKSFNGKSMLETISDLDFMQVINTNTYEQYTVWGIVLHCMYWKYYCTKEYGGEYSPFQYTEENFPKLPEKKDEEEWKKTIEHCKQVHDEYINTVSNLKDEMLDEIYPVWKRTYIQACAGMATHDIYHVAQIRNMGLEIKVK